MQIVCSCIFVFGNFGNCSSPGVVLQEGDLADAEYVDMPFPGMMFDKLWSKATDWLKDLWQSLSGGCLERRTLPFMRIIIVSPVGAKCRLCAAVFLFVENCSTPGFVLQDGKLLWRRSKCKCLCLKWCLTNCDRRPHIDQKSFRKYWVEACEWRYIYLGAISSRLSDHENILLRLRVEEDEDYALGKSSSSQLWGTTSGPMVMDCVLRNTSVWINKVYCNCVAGLLEVRIVWSCIFACRIFGNCSTPGFVLQEGELLRRKSTWVCLSLRWCLTNCNRGPQMDRKTSRCHWVQLGSGGGECELRSMPV